MSSKNRLGSDPLDFIKDTRNDADAGENNVNDSEKKLKPEPHAEKEKKEIKSKKDESNKIEKNLANGIILVYPGETTLFEYSGDLSIYSVKEIKEALFEYVKDAGNIEVDLSGVKRFDTAGFQLIYYASYVADKSDKGFTIIDTSEKVDAVAELYNANW